MEAIAAPGQYAPAALPSTSPTPTPALRPTLTDGGQPSAAVLLLEIEMISLAEA